jgi:hypothetical protein
MFCFSPPLAFLCLINFGSTSDRLPLSTFLQQEASSKKEGNFYTEAINYVRRFINPLNHVTIFCSFFNFEGAVH